MKRLLFLIAVVSSLAFQSFAQEVCNNGIDDDADGLIDCFDSGCSNNTLCDGFYLGNDANCQAIPAAFPQFTMQLDFASPDETTNHLSRIAIGDIDRDGIPEIITMNRYTKRLFILNGNDGSIKTQKTVTFDPQWEVAIGNLDNDNCAEIFFFGTESGSTYLYGFDCGLNQLWRTKINGDPINFGLADFDADGKVELYAKDEIYDAKTGVRIVKSVNWGSINGGPVAVDLLGDSKLELVLGCIIYQVNLGARTLDAGSLTELKRAPIPNEYFIRYDYSATSIADYNQDGFADVIASGSTIAQGKNTTVFFWDLQTNLVLKYSDPQPLLGSDYTNGWKNGTGRLNIADLDGDGELNVSFVSGRFLYALDENFGLFWRVIINEETSGYTGCTLFDFNGDKKSEIVYRDEQFLYIIDGTTGAIYNQQPCISRTNREYPIVADVDADGSTEICVTCGFNDANAKANFLTITYSQYSHVRVFKSASEPWVPARRLWNQHGYFNVNVNDNLTIPRLQQKHWLALSANASCTGGQPNRPLNNFLNQSPFLDSQGCPVYAAPDLAFSVDPTVNPPTCPDLNFTVSFEITNLGDVPVSGDVPITFYSTNPLKAGAVKLNTLTLTLPGIGLGLNAKFAVVNATVTGIGSDSVYVVLNDAGTSVPTPIVLPNTNIIECKPYDIKGARVIPLPVSLTALKVQDNLKCVGSSSPDNGAVRAFIPIGGGGENTIDYNFYWSNGNVAKPIPADFVGPIYTGLPAGTYTVYAIHKTANCSSDTVNITIGQVNNSVTVNILIDQVYDNCKNPNGKLRADVNGGAPVGNFTYEWHQGNSLGLTIGTSHVVTNLTGGAFPGQAYTVIVTDKSTGCPGIQTINLLDNTVKPVVNASTIDILCSNANSGSATADVGGSTAGLTFEWSDGNFEKPSPDFTGAVYSNLSAGNYTVVAISNASGCKSLPVTITVIQTPAPVVSITKTSDQTSCDATLPNGSASANVGGTTTGFDFEWFTGQNTLLANRFAITSSVSGLDVGIYTVKATDNVTGCFDTEEVTINFSVVTPSLVLAAAGGLTNCSTPNGSVKVTVSLDKASDYTFSWYDGSSVKVLPDYPDTDSLLTNLPVGTYTVKAVHNTKHCTTGPITAQVLDNTPIININLDAIVTQPPSDCNANNGIMKVNVTAPGNTGGFRIEWFAGVAPLTVPIQPASIGVTTSTASSLPSGIYTVLATNLDNGCSRSQSFDLPFLNAHALVYVSQVDVDKCAPTNIGSITVNLIKSIGPTFFESDYTIEVRSGTLASGALVQSINGVNGQLPYTTINTLTPGFYYLVAISNNALTTGCKSVPLIVEIKQVTINPVIVASTITNNTNCSGAATATGQILLDIDGAAPESDYAYVWYNGPDNTFPVLGAITTETATNLPSGFYTVEVTKSAGVSQSCSSTATFQIFDNPPIISLTSANLAVTPLTLCPPLPSDASATVNSIIENGSTVGTGGYTFQWLDASLSLLPNAITPNTTNIISGLAPGIYFVKAIGNINNCGSALVQFEIIDQTVNTVGVDLINFIEPTRCLQPSNNLGELTANATGTSTTGYTYNWYQGPNTSSPLVATVAGPNGEIAQNLITGLYTIEAINNDNQCRITDTYTLPVDVALINLTASSSPVTFCNSPPEGTLFATVIIPIGSANYDYNWYIGQGIKVTPPDFVQLPGIALVNQSIGDYTVIAIDKLDNFCKSNADTVTVEDGRIPPTATAVQLAPVTICDPLRPDGVASASVVSDVINYTFAWFEGFPPVGLAIDSGSQVGSLKALTYSVIATSIVTGCSDTTQLTVNNNPFPIPLPQVQVLSNVTVCAPLQVNGALSASVNGNTKDYMFFWYDTNPGPAPDTATADFRGEIYDSLAVSTYYVSVISRITGCPAGPTPGIIIDEPNFPDFDFKTEMATCRRDDTEPPDGYVTLFIVNANKVNIEKIEWSDDGGTVIATGPNLPNVDVGTYTVTVTSALGCATTKQVEVKTDVRPFNGISRNGDNENPIFFIKCIENFENNLVKIFNRAGTLVYEHQGYNNNDIFFEGVSNKGISPMGTKLPDGTYFYVIDKRDGSKPVAGYLEIVN